MALQLDLQGDGGQSASDIEMWQQDSSAGRISDGII